MQDSIFYINRTLISKKPQQRILQEYKDVTLQDQKVKVSGLNMKVTSHRILLQGNFEHAFLIQGDRINQVLISQSGFFSKQYMLKLRTQYGKVKFQMKNYKQAQITINGMIKNKAWNQKLTVNDNGPKMYSGLFNKIEKQKQKIDSNAVKVGQSFTSFQSLFGNLRQIKQVMKEMRTNTGQVDGDSSQVKKILKDIGFVSVISKQQAGRDFYKYLAKDLYSICTNTLFKKYGGIVSLLDLFYFYNMKRQMQLISPQQIYGACLLFQKLGMNAKLITYPNNIKVIQQTSFDIDKDFQEHFSQYFNSFNKGYSAEEIARKKGIPLSIMQIKLNRAAKRGVIAIDSRIQGIKFYKNILLQV